MDSFKDKGAREGSPKLFMRVRIVAAVDGVHAAIAQGELADEVGIATVTPHSAATTWFHTAAEMVSLIAD